MTNKDPEAAFFSPRPLFRNVAFFGDADVLPESETYKDAFEVAKLVAEQGMTIRRPDTLRAWMRAYAAVCCCAWAICWGSAAIWSASRWAGARVSRASRWAVMAVNGKEGLMKGLAGGDRIRPASACGACSS